MAELWTHGYASPRGITALARRVEDKGWDGLCVVDSQNLSGDPYVALAMAATVTERIGLGTAVTNSVTRMAAATACAIASVDKVSNGRAVLGISRGDSALAHLGLAPARFAQFERYLRHVQAFLRGDSVPFSELEVSADIAPPVEDLGLAESPDVSQIFWLGGDRKVPVEVAATGPRAIALAALHAERVMFALGADPARIAWGIGVAKQARADAGLDPDAIRFGAYVNCVCHSDLTTARTLVRGALSLFARFSILHGKPAGPMPAPMVRALEAFRDTYDMREHSKNDSPQAEALTVELTDYFAIVGPPQTCIERLTALADRGLDKLFIAANFRVADTPLGREAHGLFEEAVLPELRHD
ncbi:MAG: LLM class flavin-dependent oxidoreductase [Gammaproteobacteria bacterium]|nr:LLM class flavin-dependent oxidoreductase [Gammaproteobacteria bacterium]